MHCRRARLVPNQAARGFAPDADFVVVAAASSPLCRLLRNLWVGALGLPPARRDDRWVGSLREKISEHRTRRTSPWTTFPTLVAIRTRAPLRPTLRRCMRLRRAASRPRPGRTPTRWTRRSPRRLMRCWLEAMVKRWPTSSIRHRRHPSIVIYGDRCPAWQALRTGQATALP